MKVPLSTVRLPSSRRAAWVWPPWSPRPLVSFTFSSVTAPPSIFRALAVSSSTFPKLSLNVLVSAPFLTVISAVPFTVSSWLVIVPLMVLPPRSRVNLPDPAMIPSSASPRVTSHSSLRVEPLSAMAAAHASAKDS